MANRVTMTICGTEYTLIAEEDAAYMEKVGALVDKEMRDLMDSAHMSRDNAAVLAAVFLLLLPRYTRGAHTASRHVRYFKAKEIAVRCDSENIINLDGELDSSTPVTFKVLPGAIKLALPGEKGNK